MNIQSRSYAAAVISAKQLVVSPKELPCFVQKANREQNIVEAVRHMRKVNAQVRKVVAMSDDELMTEAKTSALLMNCFFKSNVTANCL